MAKKLIAALDACVLVPMPLADTLLRLAEPPSLFVPQWSDEILAEVTRTLVSSFGKSPEKARYRESAMREYFPDALVQRYRRLIPAMENHPKDRHVLAAAVACKANRLVTFNLKDFKSDAIARHGIAAVGPSAFLKELWAADPTDVNKRLDQQASAIGVSRELLLNRLASTVPGFVQAVTATQRS